jgi:hypothetical protein
MQKPLSVSGLAFVSHRIVIGYFLESLVVSGFRSILQSFGKAERSKLGTTFSAFL